MTSIGGMTAERPLVAPLGDSALVVRFAERLDPAANVAALALNAQLADDPIPGVVEVVPSLVSVLVRYDPGATNINRLSGEIALRLSGAMPADPTHHMVTVRFGGLDGPDLAEVAAQLGLTPDGFIAAHCAGPLRLLATGFAPGFVYCGFHPEALVVPRRQDVRPLVPKGSVLFAAGQTAIAATDIPTGWHVVGRTEFANFDPGRMPPTLLAAGDLVQFEALA
ncbi:5-oxoprolinase subunit B family protein [Devosia chinhatensis]|uniref:Carboxyltransferase domain-containing protein n=1 Tax=Devosia chinhatensis TaxID=429727 RepID=A0A0F5FMA5_9HYPH|nr:carboxyltransferase domain-containing protein [Devosia chinhatensis]KKB09685.1 hypothetical protein VE26_07400 [Devosia chinhatensis]